MRITTPFTIGLLLDGTIDLNGDNVDPNGFAYRIEALGEGLEWGNPQAITKTVSRWIADGSIVTKTGDDNRQETIPIRIMANDSQSLAAGEAEVFLRCGPRTTLVWTPPQTGDSPVSTVFDVWLAELAGDIQGGGAGDLNELEFTRYYTLTLTSPPYTRSVDLLSYPAPTQPDTDDDPIVTTVDDCSATTGWVGTPNAAALGDTSPNQSVAVTVDTIWSRKVFGGAWQKGAKYTLSLTKNFGSPVDMSDTPYLRIMLGMPGVSWTPSVKADGVELVLVGQTGITRWYKCPSSFTTLKVSGFFYTSIAMTVPLRLYDVSKTNQVGPVAAASTQELARSIFVHGSAPTYGAIEVGLSGLEFNIIPARELGDVIVYTCPSSTVGYTPALQQYQSAGPTPALDANAVTGLKQRMDAAAITANGGVPPPFTAPASQFIEGTYGAAVRIRTSDDTTDPVDYKVTLVHYVEGHPTESIQISSTVTLTDSGYAVLWIGSTTLPTQALPDESSLNLCFEIRSARADGSTSSDVYLDELWLFNLTDGAVSIIHADTSKKVWLDSPDMDRDNPTVWLAAANDKSVAIGASRTDQVPVLGKHILLPGYMDVFTVTTETTKPAGVSVSYYNRWFTHAAT